MMSWLRRLGFRTKATLPQFFSTRRPKAISESATSESHPIFRIAPLLSSACGRGSLRITKTSSTSGLMWSVMQALCPTPTITFSVATTWVPSCGTYVWEGTRQATWSWTHPPLPSPSTPLKSPTTLNATLRTSSSKTHSMTSFSWRYHLTASTSLQGPTTKVGMSLTWMLRPIRLFAASLVRIMETLQLVLLNFMESLNVLSNRFRAK